MGELRELLQNVAESAEYKSFLNYSDKMIKNNDRNACDMGFKLLETIYFNVIDEYNKRLKKLIQSNRSTGKEELENRLKDFASGFLKDFKEILFPVYYVVETMGQFKKVEDELWK